MTWTLFIELGTAERYGEETIQKAIDAAKTADEHRSELFAPNLLGSLDWGPRSWRGHTDEQIETWMRQVLGLGANICIEMMPRRVEASLKCPACGAEFSAVLGKKTVHGCQQVIELGIDQSGGEP